MLTFIHRLVFIVALLLPPVIASAPALGEPSVSEQYELSYAKEAQGDYRGALTALTALPSSARGTYTFALREAWLLYLAGDYEGSVRGYQRAIQKAPKAIEPRLGLILPQLALRRWLDAEKTARFVLERDPHNKTARGQLAWAEFNLGRFKDAEASYRAVLEDYPSDVEMKSGLAWSLLRQGRNAEAKALFLDVTQVAPSYQSALRGLAEVSQ